MAVTTIGTHENRCQQRLSVGGCKQVDNPARSFCQPTSGRRMEVEMEWFLVLVVLVLVVAFTFS